MKRILELIGFLFSDLPKVYKLRIVLGYYITSRFSLIQILGMNLNYLKGSRNHQLLILKDIFLNQIYTFTDATDKKLKILNQDAIIIDIGANIGIATAYFKNKYPSVKLLAIEASPITYKYLVKNIQNNNFQNTEAINCFISNENSQIKFYHHISHPGGSFGENYRMKDSSKLDEFDVKTLQIKDVIAGFQNLVIKIDVEGAEYDILNDLATSQDISEVIEITVEVSTFNLSDYKKLNRVLIDFYQLGFEARFISDYTSSALRAKLFQGHLQLVLFRNP
jgi:FkbM family methyltransferase